MLWRSPLCVDSVWTVKFDWGVKAKERGRERSSARQIIRNVNQENV